jgi:hypothetical protein
MDHTDDARQALADVRARNPDALVDCTQYAVCTEGAGATIWSNATKVAGVGVCPGTDGDALLIGTHNAAGTAIVARVTREDALWLGRKLVDLANQ